MRLCIFEIMKILYISTIISTIDCFLVQHIKALSQNGHIIDIASQIDSEISYELKSITRNIFNLPLQRFPFSIKNIYSLKKLYGILKHEKYEVVHVHTPVASVIGRLACFFTKTRCFYTAHGFHFFSGAPKINWLLYFPIELLMSYLTDTIITINEEDCEFAKNYLHARYVDCIPGVGLNIEKYANVKINKVVKKKELGFSEDSIILLSVGELNTNKNHQVVLKALAKINNKQLHYAICGEGNLKTNLINLAKELKINNQFHLLGYRKDIPEILKCADIFIFPSLREGLGLAALEALASGLPLIIADNRGSREFAINNYNSYVVEPTNVESYKNSIISLLNNKEIRNKFKTNSIKTLEKFAENNVCKKIINFYSFEENNKDI